MPRLCFEPPPQFGRDRCEWIGATPQSLGLRLGYAGRAHLTLLRWSRNVPRIELDQRSREARLRLEEIERLVVSKQRQARLWRIFCVLRIRISRGAPQQDPLSDRRPSNMPTVFAMLSLQQVMRLNR